MRTFDFAPLYRSTVGFDRMFDLMNQASRAEAPAGGPPYNIEKVAEDGYRIILAVAGLTPDEIALTQNGNTLVVDGRGKDAAGEGQVLHRGIATRQFRQTFSLADHVRVTGASLENGLLTIDLVREVPEALKPRRIAIGSGSDASARTIGRETRHGTGQDNTGQDNAPTLVEQRSAA